MKITEEQKQQLINLNDSRVNEILGVKELEVGKWYKGADGLSEWLLLYQGGKITYGFWDRAWETNWSFSKDGEVQEYSTEATDEEVERALIDEAKSRGIVNGVKLKRSWINNEKEVIIKDDKYELYDDETLLLYGYEIFKNGKWAEVIEKPNKQEIINQINELLDLL